MAEGAQLAPSAALDGVRVSERAALATAPWIGRGDKKAADRDAVAGMREALNELAISGRVVIGEGERDKAPMLYIGEELGHGGPATDIAVDPLEGTSLTAKGGANALAVLAMAPGGTLLNAPDVYMDKIAVGGGLPEGVVRLDAPLRDNMRALAAAKGKDVEDLRVCVLDRSRHDSIIETVRAMGARAILIGDGDIAGVIATTQEAGTVDLYVGQGGAPEGVLGAAALTCVGGQMETRLVAHDADERARAERWGITDLDRVYARADMAGGDVVFAATGVTDGFLVDGVHRTREGTRTQTLLMHAAAGTVRRLSTHHGVRGGA